MEITMKKFISAILALSMGASFFPVLAESETDDIILIQAENFSEYIKDGAVMDIPELKGKEICVSAGAVFFKKGDKRSFEELYKLADSDVYESKKINGSALNFT